MLGYEYTHTAGYRTSFNASDQRNSIALDLNILMLGLILIS